MAVELATGYVTIVPSTQGFGRKLSGGIAPQMTTAGRTAGSGFMSGFGALATGAAIGVGIALGAGISKGIAKGFDFNAMMEQRQIAFDVMLGSPDAARKMIRDIQKMAAETPFEFPNLSDAVTKSLAYGFSKEEVLPLLTSVGNAAAGLGGGPETIEQIGRALGQMKTLGKVNARDMLQLTEAGIPAWKILADTMGLSTEEVMKMSEQGILPADEAIKQLLAGMDKRFPDMMKRQSKTFTGLMSTLRDNVNMTLGQVVEPMFERVKGLLPGLISGVSRFGDGFKSGGFAGGLQAIMPKVDPASMKQLDTLKTAVLGYVSELRPAFQTILTTIGGVIARIRPALKGFAREVVPTFTAIVGHIRKVWGYLAPTVVPVMQFILRIVGVALRNLLNIVRVVMAVVRGDWKGAWSIIRTTAADTWKAIVSAVTTLVSRFGSAFKRAGSGLFNAFLDGVKAQLKSVKDTILGIVQWIRDRLPGSDAKRGPLSDLTSSGRGLTSALSRGMLSGLPNLEDAALRVAAAAHPTYANLRYSPSTAAVAGNGGIVVNVTGSRIDADYIEQAAIRGLYRALGG